MAYTSDQVVVAVKGYSRGSDTPLDVTCKFDSMDEFNTYISSNPTKYDLQLVSVRTGNTENDISLFLISKDENDVLTAVNYRDLIATELAPTWSEL